MVSTEKNRDERTRDLAEMMTTSGDMLGQAGIPRVSPAHKFLQLFLTAGWVSARQSSISKISSGRSPRSSQRRDMRTEWCRSSCRAEGYEEEGLLFPSSPLLRGWVPSAPAHPSLCAGDCLTAALGGLGSEVSCSSSSQTAVARMGTLWGDTRKGVVRRVRGHSRVGTPELRHLLVGNSPCPSIPNVFPKWQNWEGPWTSTESQE